MPKEKYNFFDDVFEVAKLIPKGRVTTYGAIAVYLGTRISARMVGWAINAAATEKDVPAHRVVNRAGLLTGKHHFGGNIMQNLLEGENIKIENDKVRNFTELFWDPSKELNI